jgi:UDP-4-amino-4,6-dideoxy-N-acetyl-beta-L-altrosamine transaminase
MSINPPFLPYARQTIEEDDIAAVENALRSDFLTTGPRVDEFERAFATETEAAHAVACNSGTAALHLAMLGLGLGPADTVIVPTITFLATANAVRMTGAEVIFADVDANTGLLTPETFDASVASAKAADRRPAWAIPVHLNGQICDMPTLNSVASQHGIVFVEDACHALGVAGIGATRHSAAACFSTHPAKAITTGEGGIVTTANATLACRMRQLRNHGMIREPSQFADKALSFDGLTPNPWVYEMREIGWNYRIPDVLCALGLSQLKKLQRFIARRHKIAALYNDLLGSLAPIILPVPHDGRPHGWHLYVVLIDFKRLGIPRGRVMELLRQSGVGSQVHYVPVHRQPYYQERYGKIALPGAEAYYSRCLSIPCYPQMTDDDVYRVVDALRDLCQRASSLSAP